MAVEPKRITGGAFGRYMAENRALLLKECAGKPATASIKLGSERYKALGASDKSKYETMYQKSKKEYEKSLAAFLEAGGQRTAPKSKKDKKDKAKKKVKDVNRPKQPAGGAYGCFLAHNRAHFMKECVGQPATAVPKLASVGWKGLSVADKFPFEEEFKTKQAAYKEAMKTYVPPAGATEDAEDDEDGEEGEEEEEEEEQDGSAPKQAQAPKKRAADWKAAEAPDPKKGKKGAADTASVEAEAKELGYSAKFKVLIANPKVKSTPSDILAALKTHKGSAVAAKHALLGA